MRRAVLLLAASAFAQDPSTTLERASDKVLKGSAGLAKYVCVETIDRQYYSRVPPPAPRSVLSCERIVLDRKNGAVQLKLEKTDRLRLAVTVTQDREIFSWTGAAPASHHVDDILNSGPISTGAYAAHLLDLFTNPAVRFHLLRQQAPAIEYGFRVPLEASRAVTRGNGEWLPTGYQGSLRIDSDSLDIERLEVETEELPPATGMCQHSSVMEFHGRQAGGTGWFLPAASRSHDVLRDARETENSATISDCREGASVPPAPSYDAPPLEPGVHVKLSLDMAIDTDVAAAGDPISATVSLPMSLAGARLTGRIAAVIHQFEPSPYFFIALAFDTLERNGKAAPFFGRLLGPHKGLMLVSTDWPNGMFGFGVNKGMDPRRYIVPAGFRSEWFTMAARVAEK